MLLKLVVVKFVRSEPKIKCVLKPSGKFVSLEILRTPKLFLLMLFFGFVWSPKEHWMSLIRRTGLEKLKIDVVKGFLDVGIFVVEKPRR